MSTTTKDFIKDNLGITHASLDDEIDRQISVAKNELIRIGVPEDIVEAETINVLIQEAVISYVCAKRTIGSEEHDGWERAWDYQSDSLRKTVWDEE